MDGKYIDLYWCYYGNPKNFFHANKEKSDIVNNLDKVQRNLLNAAPFNILDKFRIG